MRSNARRRDDVRAALAPSESSLAVASESEVAVAIVHAADGVRHLVAARSADELFGELADYVRRHAPKQLFPRSAKRVLDLIERGRADAAVRLYFSLAGRRWDEERLTLRSVELR
jgi:hypothetical protein